VICLETSVLIDYMSGEPAVEPFFDTVLPSLDEDVVIPQPVLFEIYTGHFRDLAEQRGGVRDQRDCSAGHRKHR